MVTPDFLTADHHFYHFNVIKYCGRPYQTTEEMTEDLVKRWNETVRPDQTVLVLGDFSLSIKAVIDVTPRLNGRKLLVPGNHDHVHPVHYRKANRLEAKLPIYQEAGFEVLPLQIEIKVADQLVDVCHLPYSCYKYTNYLPADRGRWLLHGHVHEKWKVQNKMINVGVDVWDYKPVHISAIEDIILGK